MGLAAYIQDDPSWSEARPFASPWMEKGNHGHGPSAPLSCRPWRKTSMKNPLRPASEEIARRSTRRGFFGRSLNLAFGALAGTAAGAGLRPPPPGRPSARAAISRNSPPVPVTSVRGTMELRLAFAGSHASSGPRPTPRDAGWREATPMSSAATASALLRRGLRPAAAEATTTTTLSSVRRAERDTRSKAALPHPRKIHRRCRRRRLWQTAQRRVRLHRTVQREVA